MNSSWWAAVSIDPLPIALELWRQSHRPELHEEILSLTCVPRWLLDA